MRNMHHLKNSHYADIMLEHMPVGVALYDAEDLRLLAANAQMITFLDANLALSWQKGCSVGYPIMDWLPEPIAPALVAIFRTVTATGKPVQISDFAFPFAEQGTTYWNWTLDPICDASGHVIQLLQTVNEITKQVVARQQAEQARAALSQANREVEAERKRLEVIETVARSMRESLDLKNIGKAAVDAISDCFNTLDVCIHTADLTLQALTLLYVRAVPSAEQLVQRNLLQIPYDSKFLTSQAYKHYDPIIIADLQTAASVGKIASDNPAVILGAHGYICVPLWFKDHFEGTLSAIFNDAISPTGPEVQAFVGCSPHIAAALAHARLHAAVENEQARLRAVLDQLPEGVILFEASDGHISYANVASERILGMHIERSVHFTQPLKRMNISDMNGQSILPENTSPARALAGETISSREVIITRPDGSKFALLDSAAPIYTASGTIIGAVIVFQDITERKSIEQHKNDFLSIASHELRTPITTIQGLAEILQLQFAQKSTLDSPRILRAINGITEQSQLLTQLIESLLDLSLIENTQLFVKLAPHDLLATITHTLETQALSARQHHFRLSLEGLQATDVLMGYFDKDRVNQVLNNLIMNAIKYSSAGSEIEVGLRHSAERPSEALIWVNDQGIGIAASELPHIFKRFHRASNFDRSISGLGIGLYLVNEIVTRHGGRVWAESVGGSGSTFYVLLPLNNNTN